MGAVQEIDAVEPAGVACVAAGRLGRGVGGDTTLHVYTSWVAESDRRSAQTLTAASRVRRQSQRAHASHDKGRCTGMSIPLRDHKMLWGRSGGRCAFKDCRISLARLSDIGFASVIGEEAHIVARSEDGPRGQSPLSLVERDSYSNLILLCPTHHALIDKIPAGPETYPVSVLLDMKKAHESWATSLTSFNKEKQIHEEMWAELIDELSERLKWNDWPANMYGIFSEESPTMRAELHDEFLYATEWIYSRVWPVGHDDLRETIKSLGFVLTDFLRVFGERVSWRGSDHQLLETDKFYKIDHWNPPLYDRLLREYGEHVALVEDLALEVTRYCNFVADLVREQIDPRFRFREGALLIRRGPDITFRTVTYRPEFTAQERASGQPYLNPAQFREARKTRHISAYRSLNPTDDEQE